MQLKLTKEYKEVFLKIRELINEVDPIGLIALSAPEDEYDLEIGDIIIKLKSCSDESEVTEMVFDVFKKWFGNDNAGDYSLYQPIGQQLCQLKKLYVWLNN